MKALRDALVALGPGGLAMIALVESAGVPMPGGADAVLLVLSIAQPGNAFWFAMLAILGSLAGSVIFHAIVRKGGEKLLDKHTSTRRGIRLRAWFQRYGMASVFVCALVPVPVMPLRVVALCAVALGASMRRFLGVMAAARIPRYLGVAYLGAQLGENSNQWLSDHLWHMGIFALVLIVGLYGLLRASDRGSVLTEARDPQ